MGITTPPMLECVRAFVVRAVEHVNDELRFGKKKLAPGSRNILAKHS